MKTTKRGIAAFAFAITLSLTGIGAASALPQNAQSGISSLATKQNTPVVYIQGTLKPGHTLTAHVKNVPSNAKVEYSWVREARTSYGHPKLLKTGPRYPLKDKDAGETIKLKATIKYNGKSYHPAASKYIPRQQTPLANTKKSSSTSRTPSQSGQTKYYDEVLKQWLTYDQICAKSLTSGERIMGWRCGPVVKQAYGGLICATLWG